MPKRDRTAQGEGEKSKQGRPGPSKKATEPEFTASGDPILKVPQVSFEP